MISDRGCQLSPSTVGLSKAMKAVQVGAKLQLHHDYDYSTLYTLHCICHRTATTHKKQISKTASVQLPVLMYGLKAELKFTADSPCKFIFLR